MIKLSISNLAWPAEADEEMYSHLHNMGIPGIEIAPSRLFGAEPYEKILEAGNWANYISHTYGISVSSMQSIWFGRSENIFRRAEDRYRLIQYSRRAFMFAKAISCKNLVLGCPRNRNIESLNIDASTVANDFFQTLDHTAAEFETYVGIEANPVIYHTNYLNTTQEVLAFLKHQTGNHLGMNLDIGAMIYNDEPVQMIQECAPFLTHVHISEPNLNVIRPRESHKTIFRLLHEHQYQNYVSIEMRDCGSIQEVLNVIRYIQEVAFDAES